MNIIAVKLSIYKYSCSPEVRSNITLAMPASNFVCFCCFPCAQKVAIIEILSKIDLINITYNFIRFIH